MIPFYVALVSNIEELEDRDVMKVAAALQKQVTRDFGPIWEIQALVSAFAVLEDVPVGYWPIIVEHDIGFEGSAGIHLDDKGQPFALVQFSEQWSLTASHECLEMLADPFANRMIAGDSIKPGQGRVEYLVEVCDPSEAKELAYTVNGVLVSDFYTPRYFDPATTLGAQYSFSGAITEPRQVLKGGYLSWHDPATDHWHMGQFFGNELTFRDLGTFSGSAGSLREQIDARAFAEAHTVKELPSTPKKVPEPPHARSGRALSAAGVGAEKIVAATQARAHSLRRQIASLREAAKSGG